MVPAAFPTLKPFQQAVSYQLDRIPGRNVDFETLSNEAKLRGFWIAGLERRDLIAAAFKEAQSFIAEGKTKQEFLDRLGEIIDQQGGTILSPKRLDLIAQNAIAVPYSAGRYAQMNDPDIVAERPYKQYPLGPHDAHTSQICLALEGLVARYDDPIWQHITPPNHHGERHWQVLTLTEQQAAETGKVYVSPASGEYPQIDGRTILPDPGWDFSPGLLTADDRALLEAAQSLGVELPAKSAADYGLTAFDEIAADDAPAIPDLAPNSDDDQAWQQFASDFGIPDGEDGTIAEDVFGDGVRLNRGTFDALPSSNMFPLIRPTIEDPFEAWMVANDRDGEIVFSKRYFGMFSARGAKKIVVLEDTPEGWLWRVVDEGDFEALRTGRLLLSKARRSN